VTQGAGASVERGKKRHAATAHALHQAWERLRAGAPTHPDQLGGDWRLSISAVCIEAGCSRNALYDGHPALLAEIRSAIAKHSPFPLQGQQNTRRSRLEADLAACRADRQRLISENAALLLRAVTVEEALARLTRQAPRPLKMTDDTPEGVLSGAGHRLHA
jgi:hypothetical protein